MQQLVDVSFSLVGRSLPADHGYALYGALSRILPYVHDEESKILGIHAIRGTQTGDRQIQLDERSRLTIRTTSDRIGDLLGISGKRLDLDGHLLRIGVPAIYTLQPATLLRSRLVTIKNALDESTFKDRASAVLGELWAQELGSATVATETTLHVGKRRTLRIKDREVVGFELIVEGLTANESHLLQMHGLGGRRRMGCGIFNPFNGANR